MILLGKFALLLDALFILVKVPVRELSNASGIKLILSVNYQQLHLHQHQHRHQAQGKPQKLVLDLKFN